jgi:hypothetical protein
VVLTQRQLRLGRYGRELVRHGVLEFVSELEFVNVHAIVVNAPQGPVDDLSTASE